VVKRRKDFAIKWHLFPRLFYHTRERRYSKKQTLQPTFPEFFSLRQSFREVKWVLLFAMIAEKENHGRFVRCRVLSLMPSVTKTVGVSFYVFRNDFLLFCHGYIYIFFLGGGGGGGASIYSFPARRLPNFGITFYLAARR